MTENNMSVTTTTESANGVYLYKLSHVLPAVFSVLVCVSLLLHIYQNFRYRFWRVTFFMFWAGTVFTAGWIMRVVSSYYLSNLNFYIAQFVFIYAGPPIYSAAEYNILGRLMLYLPMHAPMNPERVVIFFIYLGAIVESLTAAGASLMASSRGDMQLYRRGGTLIGIGLVLQGVVEFLFMTMVALVQRRCVRGKMFPRNVRILCIMLYGTSTLILLRCVFRAIETFSTYSVTNCTGICRAVLFHEWYLYIFEAVPMVIYTYWINIIHPGTLLPTQRNRYLDLDGKTERLGPGWLDRRSKWETFTDPLDIGGTLRGKPSHESFWLQPDDWPAAPGGSFANASATNTTRGR